MNGRFSRSVENIAKWSRLHPRRSAYKVTILSGTCFLRLEHRGNDGYSTQWKQHGVYLDPPVPLSSKYSNNKWHYHHPHFSQLLQL